MINYNKLSDNKLVLRVKKYNCSDSIIELMNRHKGLIYNCIKKFVNKNHNFNINDLIDDKFVILNSAVSSFNPYKKTKFSTWLSFRVSFWCLAIRRERNYDKSTPLDENTMDYFNNFYNKDTPKENKIEKYNIIKKYLSEIKDERIPYIFQRRYFDGDTNKIKSWKSIAAEMGLSHTMVINLHDKGAKIITNKINKLDK